MNGNPVKRLILMRHAKSCWDDAALGDHDRPLNLRGRLGAVLMGAWLAEQPWRIEAALISTSVRTRETWVRIAPQLAGAPTPRFEGRIYEATPEALLETLRAAPGEAETVLMLGHNPGMEEFSAMLAAPEGARPERFATSATAVFETERPWAEARGGGFRLIAFEAPKTLV